MMSVRAINGSRLIKLSSPKVLVGDLPCRKGAPISSNRFPTTALGNDNYNSDYNKKPR